MDNNSNFGQQSNQSQNRSSQQANWSNDSFQPNQQNQNIQKSRIVAGLLGVFFGWLGLHNFYLGYIGKGVLQLILTCCSCGLASIWGFIEGILILAGKINADSNGIMLRD